VAEAGVGADYFQRRLDDFERVLGGATSICWGLASANRSESVAVAFLVLPVHRHEPLALATLVEDRHPLGDKPSARW